MVPMVTLPSEMTQVKTLLDDVCEGLGVHNRPQLGMMVEVPAAALTAEDFETDFFSIGTSDLVQYTLAAARDNPATAYLTQGEHPAVKALIERTVQAANAKHIEVSLCGDLASREDHIAALLQMGLRVLSVSPAMLGRIKLAISTATPGGASDG
jgi:phosphoenolpyruvate-protein phosphotransferase (PTS system enzyme I)